MLSWKFQYPEIQGATDEWETVVNPYHLPKIRCWMHIIESNPALYERLAAALNVQLRLGGVYIADTDLFQRDVTRFLNADIGPIYFVAKQLLRAFPVYFNDVGAEGELRAVSTEIDEICQRQDTLMHFLRKQSHAESSNRLVDFSREVLGYWVTLDPAASAALPLGQHLRRGAARSGTGRRSRTRSCWSWARRWDRRPDRAGGTALRPTAGAAIPAREQAALARAGDGSSRPPGQADTRGARPPARHPARRRARPGRPPGAGWPSWSARTSCWRRSTRSRPTTSATRSTTTCSSTPRPGRASSRPWTPGGSGPGSATRDRLLDAALTVLEELQKIILSPAPSAAVENIYQKRHIAAGIPSMYGNYTEPKFDALGLSFRVERLVAILLDDLVSAGVEPYVTRDTLRRMAAAIRRFERALAADGVDSRNLGANLRLLESSFSSHNFTFHQYQNVFQFFMGSVTELSRTSILSHDQVLHTVLKHDPRQCVVRCMSIDAVAEMVLREVLVSALGMQSLDRYMSTVLRQISMLTDKLSNHALTRMMNYDPERLVSRIHKPKPEHRRPDDPGLQRAGAQADGRRTSTRCRRASSSPPSCSAPCRPWPTGRSSTTRIERVRRAIDDLEKETGLRLGDPAGLLTLSIRSGAAISMPGLMTTFVDVGLNDKLAEALSRKPGFEWAAWDSYRRFLQTWAMASGIDRDVFDAIMVEFKARYGVERKSDFLPEHMQEMAFAYKSRGRELGVRYTDDPFRQVMACIRKVLGSWDSPEAKLYRQYLGVAEEWGTAVVVQRMVFGNLSRESGSGVTFTRNPLEPHSNQVRLFGDFTARSQGEDLVAGLVFPWPVSEAQRLGSPTYRGLEHSLEKDHPQVYQALLDVARDLVGLREHDPQEIEFTFESDVGQGPVHPAEAGHGPGADQGLPVLRHLGRGLRARRRPWGWAWPAAPTPGRVAMNAAQIDTLAGGEARRAHRAAAARHGARGHRHDHPGVGAADRPRRRHLARGRHGQAPGQDRRGRLPGPGGGRAPRAWPAWPATSSRRETGSPSTGGPGTSSWAASRRSPGCCSSSTAALGSTCRAAVLSADTARRWSACGPLVVRVVVFRTQAGDNDERTR